MPGVALEVKRLLGARVAVVAENDANRDEGLENNEACRLSCLSPAEGCRSTPSDARKTGS